MSDYVHQFLSIRQRKQKLLADEAKLLERRKKQIGQFAEQFQLLSVSNAVLMGVFAEVQKALKERPEQIQAWERQGARFQKSKRRAEVAQEDSSRPSVLSTATDASK